MSRVLAFVAPAVASLASLGLACLPTFLSPLSRSARRRISILHLPRLDLSSSASSPNPTSQRPPTPCAMQPGPTSTEEPTAPAERVEEPTAEAEAVVKAEPAAVQDGEEEAKGERRGGRGRKRRRRGVTSPSSSSATAASAGAGSGVVMVKRDLLARCMTCPLCHRLLRDATTISECLHTFCRKCIYEKFNDEEVECCPACKKNLGCTPVEKLRADHSLQDVRSKLFPFKRKKIKAEEIPSPISLPTKRKERSISSLVVNTPKVKPTGLTGRRTRAVTRKAAAALHGLGPILEGPVKKEIDNGDSHSQSSSLPANSGKAPQTRRQISSNVEASNYSSNKDAEDDSKELEDKGELWRPLNCLEAANRTKSFRLSSQNLVIKGEQHNGSPSSTYPNKTKVREHLQKSKIEDDKKDVPMPPVMPKRKVQGTRRRRRELQAPADAKPDAAATQNEKKFSSLWFSLVASFNQQGDPPLPQIPSHYLRIKDGNVPASSIQKYLMQKLSLPSESEVEIKCCEQLVNPTQPLCNLVELWLRGRSTQTTQTMIGSSAKEFVMMLTYGRPKAPAL
ncbi:E3 ubiquitin protein ligase DRIP2-like [Phragmites australis]|uniref:E3 ubiquitin protein ligase DRIP2-like n=1 Tax=Phragmites australis TaxID=29695 RepID=UPI002D78A84F|nr:E3 ubiquitin protein ligase DRIP2-like [Phragmites australis]